MKQIFQRRATCTRPLRAPRRVDAFVRGIGETISRLLVILGLLSLCPIPTGADPVDVGEYVPSPWDPAIRYEWVRGSDARVVPLSEAEKDHLMRQREIVARAARERGRVISGARSDLEVLQLLVDRSVFDDEQPYELQALGVVLGDVAANQFGYEWIAYLDEVSRTRALRNKETGQVVFPVGAISQRIESGIAVDVEALFEKLAPTKPPSKR